MVSFLNFLFFCLNFDSYNNNNNNKGIPVIYDKSQIENVGFDLTISDITFAQFLNLSQQGTFN